MRVVAYVPMKLNNERLPGKNTRPFFDGAPLYHHILTALKSVAGISETYVFCSQPELSDLPTGVRYLQRSVDLDRATTRINEVMTAFAASVDADVYLLAHATAPFLTSDSLSRIVRAVVGSGHDSAMSVVSLHEFVWSGGRPLNYDPASIPRTQDLAPIHLETSGAYAYRRELVVDEGRRVGHHPALIEVSKIEAIDINDPTDWVIAEAVYRHQREARG